MSRHKLCDHFQVTFPHHAFWNLLQNNCECSLSSFEQPSLIFLWKNLHSKCWQTKSASLKNFTGQLKSKACQPDSSTYNSAVNSRKVWKPWLWNLMRKQSACLDFGLRQGPPPNSARQAGHRQGFLYRLGLRSCCTQQHVPSSFLSLTYPPAGWWWILLHLPEITNLSHYYNRQEKDPCAIQSKTRAGASPCNHLIGPNLFWFWFRYLIMLQNLW